MVCHRVDSIRVDNVDLFRPHANRPTSLDKGIMMITAIKFFNLIIEKND